MTDLDDDGWEGTARLNEEQVAEARERLLDNVELPEFDVSEPVGTPEMAEHALADLRRLRRRIGNNAATHQALIEKYDAWLEDVNDPLLARANDIEAMLRRFWREFVEANPKEPKTRKLPSGTLKSAKQPASIEVDDPELFLKWAAEHMPTLVNPGEPKPAVPSPAKNAIKHAIGEALKFATEPDPDGVVLFAEGGEVVPGVRLVQPEPKVTIET